MYLTYEEYTGYGGTLSETTFEDFEFEASSIIDWYTFNRLKNETPVPEAVKRCVFRLIKYAELKAQAMQLGVSTISASTTSDVSPVVQAQSNDGVSISYNVLSASELFAAFAAKSKGSEIEQVVQRYLNGLINSLGQKVLYRGLYPNE